MIKVSCFNTLTNKREGLNETIVDDVYVEKSTVGYNVFIDLSTKKFEVVSHGSGSILNYDTRSIIIEHESMWHTVEWECKIYNYSIMLHEICKNQIYIYVILNKHVRGGKMLSKWQSPKSGMQTVLWKLFK